MIYGTNAWIHISMGRSDRWFRWSVIGSICTALSFLIGLSFGAIGVAIAYTTSLYLLIGPCLWYAAKPINLKLGSVISVVWKYYISALCTGLTYWYILRFFDPTIKFLVALRIYERLALSFVFYIVTYIVIVMVLFRSAKPITQFISLGLDMAPNFSSKR